MPIRLRENCWEQGGAGRDVRSVACRSWLHFREPSRSVGMLSIIAKVGYTAAFLLGLAACRSYVASKSGLMAKESR